MPDHIHVEINTGTILRFILIILFFVFLYILKDVLIIFLFALVIASAISPFANWLDEKGFPRILGVLLLFLVILALIIAILSLIIPYVSQDISQLTSTLPRFSKRDSKHTPRVFRLSSAIIPVNYRFDNRHLWRRNVRYRDIDNLILF